MKQTELLFLLALMSVFVCSCSESEEDQSEYANWKEKNDKIRKALDDGKEVADRRVENALYKRALGYMVTEKTITQSEKDGYKEVTTSKHIPADVTAQIYWLKNRKPKQWRDRQETAITADIEDLTPLVELLK